MIIRTKDKDIQIKNAINDSIRQSGNRYPALLFNFDGEISAEDITAILSGSFQLLDDDENVLGEYDGYTTLKNISLSVGKITTAEQERDELQATVAVLEAEKAELTSANAELTDTIDILAGGVE